MSTLLSFDDSSNLVDIPEPANGEQKEEASGETRQPDLLLLDDPEPEVSDIKEHNQESKSKSKKSKAKRLFKRAKSPISGAINKTTKEFKKLSNLPKHHHTSPKSPIKSPSRENLTEEYSKLEQKLSEKNSEEWLQFQQMQERAQQIVLKTQSSLNKYTSQSEDDEPKEGKAGKTFSTRWTGFEEEGGLEAEVIDTSLNPAINICIANETDCIDTTDLLDSNEDSQLINTFIDPIPITPSPYNSASSPIPTMDEQIERNVDESAVTTGGNSDLLALVDSGPALTEVASDTAAKGDMQASNGALGDIITPEIVSDTKVNDKVDGTPVLSGYTFTSSMSGDTALNAVTTDIKPQVDSDILMFEQPLSQIVAPAIIPPKTEKVIAPIPESMVPVQSEPIMPIAPIQIEPMMPIAPVQSEPINPIAPIQAEPINPIAPIKTEPINPIAPIQIEPIMPIVTMQSEPINPIAPIQIEPIMPIAPVQSEPINPIVPIQAEPIMPIATMQSGPMNPMTPVNVEPLNPTAPLKNEPVMPAVPSDSIVASTGRSELFTLDDEDETDAAPVQPMQDGVQSVQNDNAAPVVAPVPAPQTNSMLSMLAEPLQPLQPMTASSVPYNQVVSDIVNEMPSEAASTMSGTATSVSDEFASFDPMKPSSNFMQNPMVGSSPIPIVNMSVAAETSVLGTSPQSPAINFGSVPPANIESDIFSKIKKMSASQPVTPKRRVVEKPKDHFGFVKKELNADEDNAGYKSMAMLKDKEIVPASPLEPATSVTTSGQDINQFLIDNIDASAVNNPFMSESFNENMQTSELFPSANAAALFGVDSELSSMDTGFDIFIKPETEVKQDTGFDLFMQPASEPKSEDIALSNWDDLTPTQTSKGKETKSSGWVDPSAFDTDEPDTAWEDNGIPKEKKAVVNAWGSGEQDSLVQAVTPEATDIFNDDFSKLDDVAMPEPATSIANPFLSTDTTTASTSAASNPFLELGMDSSTKQVDLLTDAQPTVLSNSESFFGDSVAETKAAPSEEATGDIFDPFNVTTDASALTTTHDTSADAVDMFSSAAALGDKQLAKPIDIDETGFVLDIKPMEKLNSACLPVAPAIAPPPKAPKSPQPPRENPFDRESPPEENFAQFEIKETTEKPKEITMAKSMSTESGTTSEEEVENLEPLPPYLPECDRDSFKLMLRYPTKKKIAGNRYWKNVVVKLEKQKDGLMIRVLNDARDPLPIQELLLQPCYSLSDLTLQQYDQYGKIHTVKLQYVFYKERVGIKTERITPSIVKFKKRSEKPKATMILDHSPQVSELLKFGSLDKADLMQFKTKLEDVFMNLEAHREKTLTYTKDEVTAEVVDEYYAELDETGRVLSQKARVRVFVLAFLSGMPTVEVGLNDKRRRGKEVVGRCDIIPIKTEEWIKLENVEFHGSVNQEEFETSNNIKFHPLDACQFELMRYRVRLRENKELPLQLTIQQILKNRKCEIRCDLLVTGYHSYSKKHGQFPCEDIEVHFPIPDVWIYMFRYERRFGYGSVHSAARKPGKIKGLERLTMMAQGNLNQALMEADVGTAKYEHIYRAIVWRIPRLPIRNQGAYTSHLFRLKLELGPHDEIPTSFESHTHVSFTMPCSTVSQSQIRSIAVTNPNPPEKWVRSSAKYEYRIGVEHLDEYPELLAIGTVYQEAARPSIQPAEENGDTQHDEEEERDPRLAKSDTDSSDSD